VTAAPAAEPKAQTPMTDAMSQPAETAFTYGLLFQTCFLLGRLLIGAVLAVPLWRTLWSQKR